MTDTKFTPGPWMLCEDGEMPDPEEWPTFVVDLSGIDTPPDFIPIVARAKMNGDQMADYQVMAAAPDLYAALKALVAVTRWDAVTAVLLEPARAALAKARGEAP